VVLGSCCLVVSRVKRDLMLFGGGGGSARHSLVYFWNNFNSIFLNLICTYLCMYIYFFTRYDLFLVFFF
jgi:hypothetical protein